MFIDEDGFAAFISVLKEPYYEYAQAARPTDIEDAYAFLCKFKSKEVTASYMSETHKNPKPFKNNTKPQNHAPEHKLNNPKIVARNNTEPMDTTTPRSRLTMNKNVINNQENIEEDCSNSHSDAESDNELDLNFQWESPNQKPI